jgi:hypothetical protein
VTPKRSNRARRELWSFSTGGRGYTVKVCEREPGGMLYAKAWDPKARHQVYVSLRHRDKEQAKQYARDEAEKLRQGRGNIRAGVTSLGFLLDEYIRYRSSEKASANSRQEDGRRAEMFKRVWGADRPAHDVTLADWKALVAKRLTGAIDSHGRSIRPKDRHEFQVNAGGVRADAAFIRAVYYWGMSWRIRGGATLVSFNPFGAPAKGVKSAFSIPKSTAPARPILSDDRYEKLRAVAGRVLMNAHSQTSRTAVRVPVKERPFGKHRTMVVPMRWMERSYLYEMLTIAWETGRRRDAWRTLRVSDLRWGTVKDADGRERRGITAIYWRATKHAEEGQTVPVSRELRRVLEAFLVEHPRIGTAPLFASAKRPAQAIDRKEIGKWLLEAERLAELPHLVGGSWHPFRRAWATKRKSFDDVDVMAGGGWKSQKVLKTIYQQTSDEELVEMLENPRRLEERKSS